MRRLLALALLVPLAALAQSDDGTFDLDVTGLPDGPFEVTGEARFGGVPPDAEVPPAANSVLTFEADDGTRVVVYSKDVYRPGFAAPRRFSGTYDPGATSNAPPLAVSSGQPEDFVALGLFDYGLRLDLPDGRRFYAVGPPPDPSATASLRVSRSRDDEVRGRLRTSIREEGATFASGMLILEFDATPSGTPLPGLAQGQALVVVTGAQESMGVGTVAWGGIPAGGMCAACDPWTLTIVTPDGTRITGRRLDSAPDGRVGIGWGGSMEASSSVQRSEMTYLVYPPGAAQGWPSGHGTWVPVDIDAQPDDYDYSLGGSPFLYAREYGDDEPERSYAGWTDFEAWDVKYLPRPRDVRATLRVSARYHTPDGPGSAPVTGMPSTGSFSASANGGRISGVASITEAAGRFSLQMMGGAAGRGASVTFGSGGRLAERTYSVVADAPDEGEVAGTFATMDSAGRPLGCAFESGSLVVAAVEASTVSGTFRGRARCQTQAGGTVYRRVSNGVFEASRMAPGGQIQVPDCITVPAGVTLPAASPIPACG